jgi:phosphate-selective porin OprO/OprP
MKNSKLFLILLICCLPSLGHAVNSLNDAVPEEVKPPEGKPHLSEHRPAWNQWDWDSFTFNIGGGYLTDTATYDQDENSKKQMKQTADTTLRDFRIVAKGQFKKIAGLSYTIGYMFDGPDKDWRFRMTGLIYEIPNLNGNFFIGRTKEGFSTNKMTTGYYGWTQERSAANDSFLPILADGVRWNGRAFSNHLLYNVGLYKENITPYESYDKNEEVAAMRAIYLANGDNESEDVLHLAAEFRYGTDKNGTLQYRSKPEAFPAQAYAVDTGKFSAKDSKITGLEAYYVPGSFMMGSEYYFNQVDSDQANDPFFHGGDIFASYFFTGEKRQYNRKNGVFENLVPQHSVFTGGPGAIEMVLRYSYVDLTDEKIEGGVFQRITPMINWYLNEMVRFELTYGYSDLDKNGLSGKTQYVQTRLQFSFL